MDKEIIASQKSGLLAQIEVCKNGLQLSENSDDAMEFCRDIGQNDSTLLAQQQSL